MKCQNDGKYFHGSLERAASHQCCLVKFGTGTNTSLEQYHCHWNQIVFWYFTAFVIPGKCQCEICLPSQYAFRGWWDLLSSFHLKMDAVCLQPVIPCFFGLSCILSVHDVPLSICAICPSSFFKHYFPFLMAGISNSSDLPFSLNQNFLISNSHYSSRNSLLLSLKIVP